MGGGGECRVNSGRRNQITVYHNQRKAAHPPQDLSEEAIARTAWAAIDIGEIYI